ncbi:MAG: glycosyltransferase family 9 protein [Ignavibacteriaceae bacterium]|jgi:heptosyltransferase-2
MNAYHKKILIIKIGAIGDAVMALSMLNEIDKKYPGAEITWMCGKIIAPLINKFERINKVIVIDDFALLRGNFISRINVLCKAWFLLAFKRFDIVISPYKYSGYGLLALTTIKKEFKSFNGKNRKNQMVKGRYHASEYARLIHEMDDWQLPEPLLPGIRLTPNDRINGLIDKLNYPRFIMVPAGAKNLINGGLQRRWPVEHFRSLAKELLAIYPDCSVILAGSKDDCWAFDYFKDLPVFNLIGETTLIDLIDLYNKCNILITHDTGLFHLAKLSSIKILALFGPVNPMEMAGNQKNIDWLWKGAELPCSPCYDGKSFADCSNNLCMKNISVEMVMQKISDIMK